MTGGIFAVLERTGKELIEIVFTLHPSLANPDKQGVWRGEEVPQLFTTLHLSSPLFTQVSATTHKGGIRQIQLPSLLFLLEFDEQIRLSLLDGEER